MNVAVIFAGGVGHRMVNATVPKQFLKVIGKEIIVYTLEKFQFNELIDKIVLVVLKDYIDLCNDLCAKYSLTKVESVIAGGSSGQESIYKGLKEAKRLYGDNIVVLINDGVRPNITNDDIQNAIELTKNKGNAIPVTKAIDTIAINSKDGELGEIVNREYIVHAKAPQAFLLKDILFAHDKAMEEQKQFIDSASMMQYYGIKLNIFECNNNNIKITTPLDYMIFKGMIESGYNAE